MEILSVSAWYLLLISVIVIAISILSLRLVGQLINKVLLLSMEADC